MIINNVKYSQTIWEITELLRSSESIQEALTASLMTIAGAVGAEAGSIWFHNPDDNRIYPIFVIGGKDLTGMSLGFGEGIAGKVVETGEKEVVQDCDSDEQHAKRFDRSTGFHTKSMICVPLTNRFATIGCIQLINRLDGELFRDSDVALCETMAQLSAIAINDIGLLTQFLPKKKVVMSLKDVKKDYVSGENVTYVLKGVNLDIYENELLVILGESGCGKTTLLNIIGGMDHLTSGSVTIHGKDFSNASESELTAYRRSDVGFIFQAYNLMPSLTAKENLEFIAELCREPMEAEEALTMVGLSERMDNYPSQMSGGQQQRVSIARAIVKRPKLILADEPTAALDFTTGQEVLALMEKIVEKGATVIMITHNVEIAKMANRVVKMKNGVISDITINMHPLSAAELQW